jgi:membrane-associated HD superfamily phosphohydrolase
MLLAETTRVRLFEAARALAGVAVAIGILVVLRYAEIPFFMYYPRTTNTVLVSESFDMLLFVGASLCVPLSLLLFALQPGARRRAVRNAGVILVVVLAVWLLSLVFISGSPSLAVLTLFLSTASVAIVDVSASDPVYGPE